MQFKSKVNAYFSVTFLVAIVLFSSCKPSQDQPSNDSDSLAAYETEEFLDFYDRFSKDSLYQLDHVVFPLEGMKMVSDSTVVVSPDLGGKRKTGSCTNLSMTWVVPFRESLWMSMVLLLSLYPTVLGSTLWKDDLASCLQVGI
jgi:hypothetical protein